MCKYMHARTIHNVLAQGRQYKRVGRTLPTLGNHTLLFKSTTTQKRSLYSTDTVPELHAEAPQATAS